MRFNNSPNLLLVDDDDSLVERLGNDLKRKGYNVSAATSGARAIALAQQRPFDFLVLDLGLPGEDAGSIYQKILELIPSIKLIIITGQEELITKFNQLANMCVSLIMKSQPESDNLDSTLDQAIENVIVDKWSSEQRQDSMTVRILLLIGIILTLSLVAIVSTNPLFRFIGSMCATLLTLEAMIWALVSVGELKRGK